MLVDSDSESATNADAPMTDILPSVAPLNEGEVRGDIPEDCMLAGSTVLVSGEALRGPLS
jgi:hypothetical protein